MKDKAALVIAVLMVTSIAFAVSTTSVTSTTSATGLPIVSASPGSASMTPNMVGGDKWVLLTISVTNDTGSEIFKITIRDEPENKWDSPMGGHWYAGGNSDAFSVADNWENVADNLSAAATALSQVADNLKEALIDKQNAGVALHEAGAYLILAGQELEASPKLYDNGSKAGICLRKTGQDLQEAATLLQSEPENLLLIAAWFENIAGTKLGLLRDNLAAAGENLKLESGVELENDELEAAGAALENMAVQIGDHEQSLGVIDNLKGGGFTLVGLAFDNVAENCYYAGSWLENAGTDMPDSRVENAGAILYTYVYPEFKSAANYFRRMGDNLSEVGVALSTIDNNYFKEAENMYVDNNKTRFDYLGANFVEAIDNAADALVTTDENILQAGDELREAALALDVIQRDNLIEFGSRYLGTRSDSVDNMLWSAGDNLADYERLNITTAVSGIDNVVSKLNSAATTLSTLAGQLAPTNWSLKEPTNCDRGDVELEAENFVYQIAPGGSKTFVFLWKAPNVGGDYTFKLHYEDNAGTAIDQIDTVTISVDVTVPQVVTFKVTQTGGVENVVGTVRDNGKAKITLVASEAIQELADAYIENIGNAENLLPKIVQADWTTTDNITFEYEFTVGAWDDNTLQVRIGTTTWGTDLYNNDNTENATVGFIVDTQKPIFIDNGLSALEVPWVYRTLTGELVRTDNNLEKTIEGTVQDNTENNPAYSVHRFGYDNLNSMVLPSITVEWDTSSENAILLLNENFYKKITLTEGLNAKVLVKATDWAGNSENVYIENILIDNTPPAIAFDTITADTTVITWDENGEIINDNTPEIKVTITDAGTGVAFRGRANPENLWVYLDNDENIDNPLPATGFPYGLLDNKAAWIPENGVFENIIDNAGNGLVDGTYWIVVRASDNLVHAAADNEDYTIAAQSFTIDTTAPVWTSAGLRAAISFTYEVTGGTIPSITVQASPTKIDTWHIDGTNAVGANSTVNIYSPDNTTLFTTVQADSTGTFILDITMPEGANQKVYIEEVDTGGNSSGRVLYANYTVDKTAPVITLTEPTTGISTDGAQITVSGTVVDAIVPYDELTVTIDCTGAMVAKTVYLNADGSFSTTVPLVEGTNWINVVAQDTAAITATAGNRSVSSVTVTRTVTPWATYAIIIVIVALILAAIAIFRKR